MSGTMLRDLDLNLLIALDALLTEESVTRAAESTGVTQPAMSQALARLRTAFDDPILVRSGRRMQPTALASRLGPALHVQLAQLDDLLREGTAFTPANTTRTFRVACLDHFSALHLPALIARVSEEAPRAKVQATQLSYDALGLGLEQGQIDVAVGAFRDGPAGHMQRTVHRETFRSVVRRDHPALADWDLDGFVAHPHGLLSTTGRGLGAVDVALAQVDRTRHIALRVPHFLAAGALAESTDLIFTVASRLAHWIATHHDAVCVDPPLALPQYAIAMRWHRRSQHDPAHQWFREQLARAAR